VVDVNHEDAKAYTAWLSQKTGQAYRLPSEAEWVEDCWNGSYVGAPTDSNVSAAGDCDHRMLRGGSWHHPPGTVRSAHRTSTHYAFRDIRGFRIARSLP
jgi:formylglycine-generating enzyme required for sulfatase activity